MIDGGCAEALANAALRVVREMKGVMAPESAVVVPEVVVWIVRENADGWCFECVHGVSPFGFLTRNLGQ
jgi:Na+/serine symporter